MAPDNFGFDQLERLPGNIGYVRMSYFAEFDPTATGDKASGARRTAEAALRFLAGADAVIFDLRQNGGGSPAMIDLLLSGFFGDKPVLLNRFYEREHDATMDFTTLSNFTGPRRPDVPVYVLISGRTGSAAEEFAYDVQTQKRGLIVGETSWGGANPGDAFDAGDGFGIFVSTGAAINPITKTNWEGVGVKPDVAVAAADALERAHALALEEVLKRKTSTAPTEAQWTLERLQAERAGLRLSPQAQAAYVGEFGDRRVVLENGELVYRRGRVPPARMIPLGGDAFALDGSPALRLTFERDGDTPAAVLVATDASGGASSFARSPAAAR
jgi:C-terminal processing protease CtpA/Prc